MIAAINTALERGIISLEPRENELPRNGARYDFELLGYPAIAHLYDAGWQEVSVHVALAPTEQGRRSLHAWPPHKGDGLASAHGWLERKNGKWLQPVSSFHCTNQAKAELAAVRVMPRGYAEYGKLMF